MAFAELFLPSVEDLGVWKAEEEENRGGGGRRRRKEEEERGGGGKEKKKEEERSGPLLHPSTRSPHAVGREGVGWVTGGGFGMGEGAGVGVGCVDVEMLRRHQLVCGGIEGLSPVVASLVLVRNRRSGVMFPARLGLVISSV